MATTSITTLAPGPTNTTLVCHAGVEAIPLPDGQLPVVFHQVCIDSAAAFSVIDHYYAATHLPDIQWDLEPRRQIKIVSPQGGQISLGTTRLVVHFITTDLLLFKLSIIFYRIHICHQSVLIGVPALRDSDATINFTGPWIHFLSNPTMYFKCEWRHGTRIPDPWRLMSTGESSHERVQEEQTVLIPQS